MDLMKPGESNSNPGARPAPRPAASRTLNSSNVQTHRTAPPILRAIIWIIITATIIVGLIFGARWIYHKSHHKVNPPPAVTTEKKSNGQAETGQPAAPAAGSTPGNSTGSTPGSANITNTGPGNVAAIFVSASLTAAGLHYIIRVRKIRSD